jgi:hypothetical protein
MAGEQITQAMRSFNPARSMQQAQTLTANSMQLQQARQQQERQKTLGGIREQATEGGYDVEAHKRLLMESGYFEEAMDLEDLSNKKIADKQKLAVMGFDILNKTAQITATLGASGWPVLRSALLTTGMSTPESLPEEYNQQAQKIATGLVGNTDKMLKVLEYRSGNKKKNLLVQGNKIVREGQAFDTVEEGAKDSRSAFEKQVDSYSKILMSKFENLNEKDARFLAADVFIHSKEQTDLEAAQKAYQVGLRSSYGDTDEADRIKNEVLKLRQELKSKRLPPSAEGDGDNKNAKVLQQAREAIKAGANRDAVVQRLQDMGIDPNLLDEAALAPPSTL